MLWGLAKETLRTCSRNRAPGRAAEGAFFAVLSLPPLVFGLAGSLGFLLGIFGSDAIASIKTDLIGVARRALTQDSVQQVIVPTLDAVLDSGRVDVLSIGFLIALWSGSKALHVVIDGVTTMYGKNGLRGVVKARLFSLWAYVVGLGFAIIALPLVLAGPELIAFLLPTRLEFLGIAYWPAVSVVSTVLLALFFHFTVPDRKRRGRRRDELPGAIVVMLLWLLGSHLLRVFLTHAIGGTSIYGPLAAPIVILVWLYLVVFALLIGAAVNASLAARSPGQSAGEVAESSQPADSESVADHPRQEVGSTSSQDGSHTVDEVDHGGYSTTTSSTSASSSQGYSGSTSG